MIIELLVLLTAWAGLGMVIRLAFEVPFYLAVPLAFILLVLYDFIAHIESRETR